ncbi:hypothetical protein KIPB_000182 [Kipferlia bialata]|uniref:Uncharacterized protein n=1 Tax=Kipferlia bialata TaxID=797122 RepID=A0A9K3GE58_9EUKA|nr:hypothetical protein KIPB_000182 [Kipferlia bialata]|eukprot:g182.t1
MGSLALCHLCLNMRQALTPSAGGDPVCTSPQEASAAWVLCRICTDALSAPSRLAEASYPDALEACLSLCLHCGCGHLVPHLLGLLESQVSLAPTLPSSQRRLLGAAVRRSLLALCRPPGALCPPTSGSPSPLSLVSLLSCHGTCVLSLLGGLTTAQVRSGVAMSVLQALCRDVPESGFPAGQSLMAHMCLSLMDAALDAHRQASGQVFDSLDPLSTQQGLAEFMDTCVSRLRFQDSNTQLDFLLSSRELLGVAVPAALGAVCRVGVCLGETCPASMHPSVLTFLMLTASEMLPPAAEAAQRDTRVLAKQLGCRAHVACIDLDKMQRERDAQEAAQAEVATGQA